MKKLIAATLACMPAIAAAQGAAPAPTSPVTGNMAIVSDYRFRGISQSYLGPAIQGGIDYAHPSGFYIGNWNSSVSSLVYTGGSGIAICGLDCCGGRGLSTVCAQLPCGPNPELTTMKTR